MPFSLYCKIFDHPEFPDQVVLFSTRTAALASIDRGVLRDIEQDTLSADERDDLTNLGFIVPSRDQEKTEMLAYIDEMNALSTSVKPIIVMNLDCNLACPYCFEGTRKGKYFLSEETAYDLVRFIDTQFPGKKEINPTFYGGEPLLSLDMIANISEQLRDIAHKRGGRYEFRMITNGTLLTRKTAERLKAFGLRSVQVTLDGSRETHDASRPFKSGTGSFDTIVSNLREVCELVDVQVGGNYTQENYRDFVLLLDYLPVAGLGPDRIAAVEFGPVFRESAEFVPDFHDGCKTVNEPWIVEAGNYLRSAIRARGFRTAAVEPTVCMMERRDHFVVNWDGGLYQCPSFIGRTEFRTGTIKSGRSDYDTSHNLGNWKNDECLVCRYLPLCFGGCRFMKLLRDGHVQGIDCKKEYFDAALPTLVMQDLFAEQRGKK